MRWRKQVTAESLTELEAAAERYFRPGTTYSIFSVRDETPAGVFLSYRAEAHAPETPGTHSTSRRGGRGGTESGQGTVRGSRSATSGPDDGPVTGRIVEASVSGPVGGPADGRRDAVAGAAGGSAQGPAGGPGVRIPGGGTVAGYNPETVDEIHGWRPEEIPARVLAGGPGLNAAYALLQDPDLDLPAGPVFATDDPEFTSLLDRAAPPEDGPAPAGEEPASDETGPAPVREGPARDESPTTGRRPAAGGPLGGAGVEAETPAEPDAGGLDRSAVVGTLTQRPGIAGQEPKQPDAERPDAARPEAERPDVERPEDADGERPEQPPSSARQTVVYVGLLDDPVEAAERSGHRRWSAAGVLNGGQPGARVVCYGLGDGSNATRLAEGLHRYQPMRLVLAVDASRKHADTQAWVRQVAQVVQPSSLVSVAWAVTSSPGTVQELGYPVQYLR